ncbi:MULTISPECIES: hypothetical protein [unclassified Pseudomonas]|jgi:hypothetical protein|uniref:hypothetical protein n=1 Tax=Pseudomonas TaxID=286 RepID=UPI000A1E2819|nr:MULTISPECIES: hypothetical protein [unclassified Pseudomonas]MCH4900288.1 hypothetical protein [Pseudomonas sp. B707]TEA61548.1 hypothetical protein EIY71_12495 [Pseudomonas sp. CH235]
MTAQQSVVAAPDLEEAVKGVAYIEKLSDPTPASVSQYFEAAIGDVIEMLVSTSTGSNWSSKYTLSQPLFPVTFDIPKSTFANNLVSGATANLRYTIAKTGSPDVVTSPTLTVRLEP